MAFNKDDFLAAFLERSAEGIESRGLAADQYAQEQKAAAERNAALVTKRKQTAEQAAQLGKRLIAMGVGKGEVLTAMSSGAGGIQELYNKIDAARQQRGVTTLGKDDIAALVEMPNLPSLQAQYADIDKVDLSEFAAKTYGAVGEAPAAPAKQVGLFGSLLGFGGKARVDAQLRKQQYGDGMTYAEINAAARNADYQSMFDDATMTFTDVKYFDNDAALDFTKQISTIAADALDTPAAEAYLAQVKTNALQSGAEPNAVTDAVKKAQKEIQEDAVKPFIEMAAQTYANGNFFSNKYAMKVIESVTSKDYLKDLRKGFNEDEPVVQEDAVITEDKDVTPPETPKEPVKPLVTKPASADPNDPFPPAAELDEEGKAIVENALSGKAIFRKGEEKYTDKYTKAQWDKMTRQQRRERGLPESPLGALNFYFREDIDEMIAAPKKNLEIKRNIDKSVYKINIKGRGTYHVTADQLKSIDDSYFRGSSPAIVIEEYETDEKKAKNITKPVLKAIGVE